MSLNKEQEALQNALTVTFLANLAFLSEYDNNLYQRVEGLSQQMNSGNYKQRYQLEFVKDDGDFDIYDNLMNKYLYNYKPKKFNNQASNSINFDTKGQFITLDQYYYSSHPFYETNEFEINNSLDSMKLVLNDVQKFVSIMNDNLVNIKDRKIKKIDKFIFIGTLLSRHIFNIVKKTKAKHFFICEDNLEIFRLSLFVFDYTLLVENNSTVVFSIMEDSHVFASKFRMFYQNNNYHNHTLKYFSTNYNVEKYFNYILDGIVSNNPMTFDYQRILKNIVKYSFERINNRNIICSKLKDDNSILKEKPVLFVGAGPSFLDNIEWIKENQNYFIIVAMGASYSKLLNNDIRVDIIASIDPTYEIIEKLQFNDENILKIDEQIILLSINTHEKIEKKFKTDNIFEFLVMANLHEETELQGGYSIGEIITVLLLQMGVEDLYLVGLDFALDQKTGLSHAEGSNSSVNKFDLNDIKSSLETNTFDLRLDLFKVKGNIHEYVYTNRLFNMSLFTLSKALSSKKFENKNIFNLSENGAFIENTTPLNKNNFINRYKLLDLEKLNIELKSTFTNKSKRYLSLKDKLLLKNEKEYLEDIDKELSEKLLIKIFTYEDFLVSYEDIFTNLVFTNIKTSFVAPVFKTYFDSVMIYIDYCFNDKKIKREKEKINEIRVEITSQLRYLIKIYSMYLEKCLEDNITK
jgi:hypothetical protein